MNQPEIVSLLVKRDEKIAQLQEENAELRRQLASIIDKVERDYTAWKTAWKNQSTEGEPEKTQAFIRGNVRALQEIQAWISEERK